MLKDLKISLFLGFKSIARGNKATIALMIFILSLAFVNLVFISSILNGVLAAINKQIVNNVVSNIVIEPQEKPVKKDFIIHAGELQNSIGNMPGITAVIRHYKLTGMMAYDKEKNGKFIYRSSEIIGIDPEKEKQATGISQTIVAGRYLEGLGTGDIILGADLTGGYGGDELNSLGGAKIGDKIKITFNNGMVRNYTLRGIFRANFGFADRMAFVTAKEAESILSVYDNASQVLVKIDKTGTENYYMDQIRSLAPALKVKKWTDYMGSLEGVAKSFDMISLMISAIGLVVTAVTIFILIYVNAVHKRRQIGILKAIGIKQNIIIWSYIFQALFYAISGIIIGAIIVFYGLAPYFESHPLDLPVGKSGLALDNTRMIYNIISLLAAALIAGLIPSWQAARENILKAIWGT